MTDITKKIGTIVLDYLSNDGSLEKKASHSVNDAKAISLGLTKVANSNSVNDNMQHVVKEAAGCINSLLNTINNLNVKTANFEKSAKAREIIEDMVCNGIISEFQVEEKVAELMNKTDKDLEVVKEAVKLNKSASPAGMFDGVFNDSVEKSSGWDSVDNVVMDN